MADDESFDIEGYDGAVDDGPSYGVSHGNGRPDLPRPGRAGAPGPGRRGGKKTLNPSPAHSGRRGRPMSGRSIISGIRLNPRELARSVNSLLAISVIGVLLVGVILLYTFTTYGIGDEMRFYGALAAAMAVMLMLSYITVRLLGSAG